MAATVGRWNGQVVDLASSLLTARRTWPGYRPRR